MMEIVPFRYEWAEAMMEEIQSYFDGFSAISDIGDISIYNT